MPVIIQSQIVHFPQEKLYSISTSSNLLIQHRQVLLQLLIQVKTVFLEYILYPVRPKDQVIFYQYPKVSLPECKSDLLYTTLWKIMSITRIKLLKSEHRPGWLRT